MRASGRPSPGAVAKRRPSRTVLLVGFQDQGNLGMGYLAAALGERGYDAHMLDIRSGSAAIVAAATKRPPLLVGFSLIFQYFAPQFASLAAELRDAGVDCHFTMGGHFPSLCPEETLQAIPDLDSVVRFEGELTLVDLCDRLAAGREWRDTPGLALKQAGEVKLTAPRALVADLDALPWPCRPNEPEQVLGLRALPILASRGCIRRCSFCSIHMFYRTAPGKVVRRRDPARVVEEMKALHEERGVDIFLFQDDDLPIWGRAGERWIDAVVDELYAQELVGEVIWKISCRADYIEPALFSKLRDAGLYLVYMGLESGTEEGLDVLNKQIEAGRNLAAVEMLKALGLVFEYGFMLFDPSSTFDSVVRNIRFMRRIVGDGSAGAVFCRMLPYGGTPIRDALQAEGRLKGDITRPDYDFLDPRLNEYCVLLDEIAGEWVHGEGVSHQLNWAWHELAVLDRLFPPLDGAPAYKAALTDLTRRSNEALFDLVEESAHAFPRGGRAWHRPRSAKARCGRFVAELLRLRADFIAPNQPRMLATVRRDRVRGPITAPQIF